MLCAALSGYAVASERTGVIVASESLELVLARVAELLTDREVHSLNLVFVDEVQEPSGD